MDSINGKENLVTDPVFDFSTTLDNLDGDKELLKDLVALFIEDAPNHLNALKIAVEQGSIEEIKRHAHTLKGASANIGARQIREEAVKLEVAANADNLPAAATHISELHTQFDHLVQTASSLDWADLAQV